MLDIPPKSDRTASAEPGPGNARDFDLRWICRSTGQAERRQIVAIAIGFAPVAANDPEEIVDLLARRHGYVGRIVARYGGKVDRLDPNLQLASWGWPVAGGADSRLAVAAALEIAAAGDDPARCGVDVGIAVAVAENDQLIGIGVVGGMSGTATALQARAPWGQVVVSAAVRSLIAEEFELNATDHADSGSDKAERCWTASKGDLARPSQIGPGGRGLVGLVGEIEHLQDCWRATAIGKPQHIRIEGEAGVGKSALVAHLKQHIHGERGQSVVIRCLPETRHIACEPITRLCLALDRSAAPRNIYPPPRSAADAKAPLIDDLMAMVRRCAGMRPMAVIIEDIQFADTGTLAAIERLACAPDIALLLVTTRRLEHEDRPAEPQSGRGHILHINRLSTADTDRLLMLCEHGPRLDTEVRRQIADRADGVPMHIIELARLCAESHDREAYHRLLARPNRISPGLTSRLDALAMLKPLAQAAAILGREFDARVLAGVLGMDVRNLLQRLDMLVGHGILLKQPDHSHHNFRFASALLWSQAYGSVLKVRRKKLHAGIAEELRHHHTMLCESAPEVVARHHMKAGAMAEALSWWSRAAHAAAAAGAATAVVSHVNQALAAKLEAADACSALDEAKLMSLLGAQLRALHGSASNETIAAYERALELVTDLPGKPANLGLDIAWGLAAILLSRGDIRDAVSMSGRLLDEAREQQRDDIELLALRMHGTARLLSGSVAEAVELFTAAAEKYNADRHCNLSVRYVSNPGAVALAHLAAAHALAGNAAASRSARQRALALTGEIGHPHTSANVLGVLALAAIHLEETGIAAALARASQVAAERYGNQYWAARAQLVLAWAKGLRSPQQGIELIGEAIAGYHRTGAGRASVLCRCLAAQVAIKAGMPQAALDLLGPVRDKGQLQGEWIYIPEVMRLEALALSILDPGDVTGFTQRLRQAEAMARQHGSIAFAERAARTHAGIGDGAARNRPLELVTDDGIAP